MPQPEVYLGEAAKLFAADGDLASVSSREFLTKFMKEFVIWVARNQPLEAETSGRRAGHLPSENVTTHH